MLMNMKDLLAVANEHKFAVPAFNISDYSMMNGIFEASEEKQAPVIIAIHPDELKHTGTEIVKAIIEKAHKATVPVCIHLDHGATFEQVMLAIQSGFTSVMIDGSSLSFEDNIAVCKKVAEALTLLTFLLKASWVPSALLTLRLKPAPIPLFIPIPTRLLNL